MTRLSSIFIPRKGFFAIPLLIDINLYFFVRVALYCSSFVQPEASKLLECGVNFGPLTLTGEWWRILTCNFIHIGILHLLMNLYALLYIGLFLEPLIGRRRIFVAYLLTGLCSAIASLLIHPEVISAGASGAIFGLYGIFLVYLLSHRIEKEQRLPLLISIGLFMLYNLAYGFSHSGIDNAAHIGGLVSGCLLGALYLLGERLSKGKEKQQKILYPFLGEAVMAVLIVLSFTYAIHRTGYANQAWDSQAWVSESIESNTPPKLPPYQPMKESDTWMPFRDEATGFSCRYPTNWHVVDDDRAFFKIVNGVSWMTVVCLTLESEAEFNHIRDTTPIIPSDEHGNPAEDYHHEIITVNGYTMNKVENPLHIAMSGTAGFDVTQTVYYYFDKPRLRYFAIVTEATDATVKKELESVAESIYFE